MYINKNVIDFTKNGKCSKCGACCSNILPLDEADIKLMKRVVKKKHLKPIIHHRLGEMCIDMVCPFLDSKNRCSIYDYRPKICHNFICSKHEINEKDIKYLGDKLVVRNVKMAIWGDD